MTALVVCRAPGDELSEFGGLLLSRPPGQVDVVAVTGHPLRPEHEHAAAVFRNACRAAGVRHARLLPFAHLPNDPLDLRMIADALGPLDVYERIYTHSVQDARPLCARIPAAVALVAPTVWTSAGGGAVDEVVHCSGPQFQKRLALLAEHYPDLLEEGWVAAHGLRDIDLFQCHRGTHLSRYFRGYVDWHVGGFDYRHPWELEHSEYERLRHEAELQALRLFPWQSLVEVGACEGTFTEKLCDAFPGRRVIAFEPDPFFFTSLRQRLSGRAQLHQGDADAAGSLPSDVVFMSSAIYYLWKMPYGMLRNARYVVASHAARYHGELDRVLMSQGFKTVHRATVAPRIEPMEGILEVKYGTEIKVWKKG
jgi:hypothetical protein